MQALIDFVIKNLMKFWPIARIYTWERGVRVRCGHMREELGPGLHWRWPFVEEVFRCGSTEYTLDLATGAITTADGEAVALSANIAYRITSAKMMWEHVTDIDKSIQNVALGYLASRCSGYSWRVLSSDRARIQQELACYMTAELAGWGTEVTRVGITDLVRAKQWRIFGDSAVAGKK